MNILQPSGWTKPKGYANGIAAQGRMIFVAGQIGWDGEGVFHSDDFVEQTRQALTNIVDVLAEDGAGPQNVVRLNWYVTDKREYLARSREVGRAYRAVFGDHYPAMTLVEVSDLLEERARVEIEATAMTDR